ncbi:hypothetical protein [Herbiconiux ginsengi]|uniref:Uncharacterized protein n=1 Tax=Herbiconiux ginsengi TaxID=381665 RepID=A0A1H3T4X0_9MICO|nr:hypothetical protein [Herbiconiux ginsengi]SDZ45090.1 hypothetical protein SAMN05216554_3981 [Herbiconiux ginsengi]
MVGSTSTPRVAFVEFANSEQRMLQRYREFLEQVERAADPVAGVVVEPQPHWVAADSSDLHLWRLCGLNQREVGRSARTFSSIDKARRNAEAIVAAGDHLTVHLVHDGMSHLWYISLFGSPALVGVGRYPREDRAQHAAATAKRLIAAAVVQAGSKRLPLAATGPLSLGPASAHRFPSSNSGDSRPENGMPAPADLGTGTRE